MLMITHQIHKSLSVNENLLLVKIRSMQEPRTLRQVFRLIKFIKPLTLIKSLRILTGKKHRQMKLQRLPKVQTWAFGLLIQQINSL